MNMYTKIVDNGVNVEALLGARVALRAAPEGCAFGVSHTGEARRWTGEVSLGSGRYLEIERPGLPPCLHRVSAHLRTLADRDNFAENALQSTATN